MTSETRRLAGPATAAAVGVGALIHLALQAGMMLTTPGWGRATFRNYFWYDQLSYLAIVKDAADGNLSPTEPFTETGTNHYPRAYYQLLGTVARMTHVHVATAWTAGGLAAQALLVMAIGTACALLTRRWWTGLLGPVPFLVGAFAWTRGAGWYTEMSSHAVLWGPFGVAFTLNGESVALCVAGAAFVVLLVVAAGRLPQRAVWPVTIVACALVGLTANMQTYTFLVSVFLLAFGAATAGLVARRRAVSIVVSVLLFAVPLIAGPPIAKVAGPLLTLGVALVPALPGLIVVGRLTRWRAIWAAVALVVAAAPQTVGTALGVLQGDPFLVYRQASSQQLGVGVRSGLLAGSPGLVVLVLVLLAGLRLRRVLWTALPIGMATVWALLAANDHWGANQEPYRFWLDANYLIWVVLVPLAAWTASEVIRYGARQPVVATADSGAVAEQQPGVVGAGPELDAVPRVEQQGNSRLRVLAVAGLVLAIAVAGASSVDWWRFRKQVTSWGYIDMLDSRHAAPAAAAMASGGRGLVLPDPCIDPLVLKADWGGPVAFYNLGLAWPAQQTAMRRLLDERNQTRLDLADAAAAGVQWVLVDTSCTVHWADDLPGSPVTSVSRSADSGGPAGEIQLWRLPAVG